MIFRTDYVMHSDSSVMLSVHPGDVISAEVFAKYNVWGNGSNNPLTNLAGFLTASLGGPAAVDGFNVVNTSGYQNSPVWAKLVDVQPRIFLNYILFDNDNALQKFDFDQVTSVAQIPAAAPELHQHERLLLENITIEKDGFIYIYVSNESPENIDAYFDDLKVTQTFSDIVAGGDFYPYGLAIKDRQITRDYYRHGYQGKFSEKDDETGWNHFELREYDAVIGRTITTDPARQFHSPYAWVGNNPVGGTDPNGGEVESPIYSLKGKFLGTDSEGLQGEAIFMDESQFTQGMNHESALKAGFTFSQHFSLGMDLEARATAFDHMQGLSSRPDWDGVVTDQEARDWWRTGNGQPLFVNRAQFDLRPVTTGHFSNERSRFINFFYTPGSSEIMSNVYGTVRVTLLNRTTREVRIGSRGSSLIDTYDFNYDGRIMRDLATWWAREIILGNGNGFEIHGYGANPTIPVQNGPKRRR